MPIALSLLIGIVFGFFAGAAAFLITYNEYRKHHFSQNRLIKTSLNSALFAFLFFALLSFLIFCFLNNYFS
jgi:H+/Cl- antiporter ClcA